MGVAVCSRTHLLVLPVMVGVILGSFVCCGFVFSSDGTYDIVAVR